MDLEKFVNSLRVFCQDSIMWCIDLIWHLVSSQAYTTSSADVRGITLKVRTCLAPLSAVLRGKVAKESQSLFMACCYCSLGRVKDVFPSSSHCSWNGTCAISCCSTCRSCPCQAPAQEYHENEGGLPPIFLQVPKESMEETETKAITSKSTSNGNPK